VRARLQQFFDREIEEVLSADQGVALGTGVFAARLAKHPVAGVISDRSPT
jgi:hypothetical protein